MAQSSWWRTVRAVAWALLGVRNKGEYQRDQQEVRPLQVIAIGLLALILFVVFLISFVKWVA